MLETFYKERINKLNNIDKSLIDTTLVHEKNLFDKKDKPIMIIGEAPGEQEVLNGMPFCGPSGKNLEYLLSSSGLKRKTDLIITNIFPFRTFDLSNGNKINRTPNNKEISLASELLKEEIKIIQPSLILFLGGSSYKGGCKIFKELKNIKQNEFILFEDYSLGYSFHPSPIAFNRKNIRDSLLSFFKEVKEMSNF